MIEIIDLLKPKNGGSFKLIEDIDIAVDGYSSLADCVAHMATTAMIEAINAALSGKQDKLTTAQLTACNSGITSDLVAQITTNTTAIAGKADAADLTALATTVNGKADASDLAATNATVAGKADASDVTTATADLQAQIDAIVTPVTQDAEVQNARVGENSKTYNTLKARLDAEYEKSLNNFEENKYYINEINSRYVIKNFYNSADPQHQFVEGTINSSGSMTTADAGRRTGYIRVEPSKGRIAFSYTHTGTYSTSYVVTYDADKTFIQRTQITTGFTPAANVAYIALFFASVSADFTVSNVQLEYGSSSTTYEAYNPKIDKSKIDLATLTFTGAATGTYSGQSDLQITIPDYSTDIANIEADKWGTATNITVDTTGEGDQRYFTPYVVNTGEKVKFTISLDDVSLETGGVRVFFSTQGNINGETEIFANFQRVETGFTATVEATAGIDAKYLYFRIYGTSGTYEQKISAIIAKSVVSVLAVNQAEIQNEIDDIVENSAINYFESKNIYDANNDDEKFVEGTISSSTGAMTTDASGRRTGYIKVNPSSKLQFTHTETGERDRIYCAYYTADKTFISREQITTVINTPATCGYIGVFISSVSNDYTISNVQIEYGQKPTEYSPYKLALLADRYQLYPDLAKYIFEGDKSQEIEWTAGAYVKRIRTTELIEASGYSYAELSVKKGDIIILDYTGHNYPNTVADICKPRIGSTGYICVTNEITGSVRKWISDIDGTITVSIRPGWLENYMWIRMPANAQAIDIIENTNLKFSDKSILSNIAALKVNPMAGGYTRNKPISILHYSDVHGANSKIQNIEYFRNKYSMYIDDVIITGDMSPSRYTDYVPIYAEDGYNHHLLCIGNHDVYDHNGDAESHGDSYADKAYWATAAEKYEQYFADSVAYWNVTQPANAAQNGYCYYYKDYATNGDADETTVPAVRLIVLDAMAYDAAQHSWLVATLTDARTNGYAVVIADHFIPMETDTTADYNGFNTSFDSLMSGMELWYGISYLGYLDGDVRYKATTAVDDFITAGGEFMCWLCGHMHYAKVGTLVSHPNQIYIAVEKATANQVWDDVPRVNNTDSEDLFNIVSFDTYNKLIKVYRVGACFDDHMRHRGAMCINYSSKQLVSSW